MDHKREFLIHPSFLLLFLLLAGISALFLGFSFAYLYNRINSDIPPIELPSLFYANTLILLASSGTLLWAKKAYKSDDSKGYKLALSITFMLTILFLIAQIFAWRQLRQNDILLTHSTMASYMYVISIIHFVHVVAGIPFLFIFLKNAIQKIKSPVSVLIYFSDESKRCKLKLFNIYWHYLDVLWIYLVLFFLINWMIQ